MTFTFNLESNFHISRSMIKNSDDITEREREGERKRGNYIDGEPLQSRSAKSLTKAYLAIFQRWKATGVICSNWHILDNEAPEELKQAIRDNKCRVR